MATKGIGERVVGDKKRSGKRAVARPEAGEPSVGKSKEKSKAASIAFDMVCTQECKSAKLQISDDYFNGYNTGIRLS